MYSLTVTFDIFPEHREAFIQAALKQAKNSLANEPGCTTFNVYESAEQPNLFHFHEIYTDKAAFENVHVKTPYFAAYREGTTPFIKERTTRFWNSLDG